MLYLFNCRLAHFSDSGVRLLTTVQVLRRTQLLKVKVASHTHMETSSGGKILSVRTASTKHQSLQMHQSGTPRQEF